MKGTSAILAMMVFCSAVPAGAFFLPDSDQRTCYQTADPWGEIPCGGTGQDGDRVANPLRYTDHDDGTVTDDNTGLMWQQADDNQTYNWYEATGTYHDFYNTGSLDVCGSSTLAGHVDWRLPGKGELAGIVDYAVPEPGPAVAGSAFPGTDADRYWTSTPYPGTEYFAWAVNFLQGSIDGPNKGNDSFVRCVRGGETKPAGALTDNLDGTVTDSWTGLTWQQAEPGLMLWGEALSSCEGLDLADHQDWRLPNVKELASLADDVRTNPAVDTTLFPGAQATPYWASTTCALSPGNAWMVHFIDGFVSIANKAYPDARARCVRGGNVFVPGFAVAGAVRTRGGTPIAKVTMTLTGESGQRTVKTNEKGKYLFTGVAPGMYKLKPAKKGWAFTPVKRLFVVIDADVTGLKFTGTRQ